MRPGLVKRSFNGRLQGWNPRGPSCVSLADCNIVELCDCGSFTALHPSRPRRCAALRTHRKPLLQYPSLLHIPPYGVFWKPFQPNVVLPDTNRLCRVGGVCWNSQTTSWAVRTWKVNMGWDSCKTKQSANRRQALRSGGRSERTETPCRDRLAWCSVAEDGGGT